MNENLKNTTNTSEQIRHSEGRIALAIEEQTARIPSDMFLWGALGSIGLSLILQVAGKKDEANFVGKWVSPFLLLGVYNKLVKVGGSDRLNRS